MLSIRSPGYVLRVESDELDLHRLERLVDEGRSLLARSFYCETVPFIVMRMSLGVL